MVVYGWGATGEFRSSGRPNGKTGLAPIYSRLVAYVNVVRPGGERTRISSSRESLQRRRCRVVVVTRRLVGGARFATTLTPPTPYQRTIRSIDGGLHVQPAVAGKGEQCPSSIRDSVSQPPSSQPTVHKTL